MLSALLLSMVWGLLWLFRRNYDWKQILMRLLPAATVLSFLGFLAVVFACLEDPMVLLARPTMWSVGACLLTYLYAVLTIVCAFLVVVSRQWNISAWIWWHACLVSTANGLVVLYLTYWGIIGVRTWA